MSGQNGLGNHRPHAARTKQEEKRRDEMNKRDDDLAHQDIVNNMAKSAELLLISNSPGTGSGVIRTPSGLANDAHQFFAKFSYLIRF